MGDYQALEEVTEENWREQQTEDETEDPEKADAVRDYENSMQQDSTAVITDGEESGEDYDLDYGFEDLVDSSSDDDCCVVSVSDSDSGVVSVSDSGTGTCSCGCCRFASY